MADVADLFVTGGEGGGFITPEDRADLAKNGTVLEITGAKFEASGKYGASYILNVTVDGEERLLRAPFNTGMDSRDATVKNIAEYIGNGGGSVKATISPAGNGWVFDAA